MNYNNEIIVCCCCYDDCRCCLCCEFHHQLVNFEQLLCIVVQSIFDFSFLFFVLFQYIKLVHSTTILHYITRTLNYFKQIMRCAHCARFYTHIKLPNSPVSNKMIDKHSVEFHQCFISHCFQTSTQFVIKINCKASFILQSFQF